MHFNFLSFSKSFIFLSLSLLHVCSALYDHEHDPGIIVLNDSNFDTILLAGPGGRTGNLTFIVQFYNSWCGHCIRYAPHFKQFARKTQPWTNHLKVGVVDCSYDYNRALCSRYHVTSTPAVHAFPPQSDHHQLGEIVTAAMSAETTLQVVLQIMAKNGRPEEIRELGNWRIDEVWRHVPNRFQGLAIIVEATGDRFGLEAIMNLLPNLSAALTVRRTPDSNRVLLDSLSVGQSGPYVIFTERRVPQRGILGLPVDENPKDYFTEHILRADEALARRLQIPVGSRVSPTPRPVQEPSSFALQTATPAPAANSVNIQDLDSTIVHSLTTELAQRQLISDGEFSALRLFLTSVVRWVPVKPATLSAVRQIIAEMSRRHSIAGAEIAAIFQNYGLSRVNVEWHNCKSSVPNRRGYPCGLWQVFHTMTVRAFDESEDNAHLHNAMAADGALTAVIGYIEHFFTCGECSRNFMREVRRLQQRERLFMSNRDAVLFLWRAHNNANRFLAGDATEDPAYPKMQFPYVQLCTGCRNSHQQETASTIDWDAENVVEFLRRFYGMIPPD